jgi:hypothetical protein
LDGDRKRRKQRENIRGRLPYAIDIIAEAQIDHDQTPDMLDTPAQYASLTKTQFEKREEKTLRDKKRTASVGYVKV